MRIIYYRMARPLKLLKHRRCEACGNEIALFNSDIERGKGMFCSPKCTGPFRKMVKYERTCENPTCNCKFKTTLKGRKFCCVECANECGEIY